MSGWAIYERLQQRSRDGLSPSELSLLALAELRAEVNSGDFDRYLRYTPADTVDEALAVCHRTVGLETLGDLLSQALARVGTEARDAEARAAAIDDADLDFDDLDERFYALEAQQNFDEVLDLLASALPDHDT